MPLAVPRFARASASSAAAAAAHRAAARPAGVRGTVGAPPVPRAEQPRRQAADTPSRRAAASAAACCRASPRSVELIEPLAIEFQDAAPQIAQPRDGAPLDQRPPRALADRPPRTVHPRIGSTRSISPTKPSPSRCCRATSTARASRASTRSSAGRSATGTRRRAI